MLSWTPVIGPLGGPAGPLGRRREQRQHDESGARNGSARSSGNSNDRVHEEKQQRLLYPKCRALKSAR